MSQLHETFAKPGARDKRTGLIFLGLSSAIVAGTMFGPNFVRAYHQGQDIEHKRGPAKAYVTKTLGQLVLDGQQLKSMVDEHECDNEPNYGTGDVSRHCRVHGEATYVIKANKFSDAYDQASAALKSHNIQTKEHAITYQGQSIDVNADFSLSSGLVYNNSIDRDKDAPRVPKDAYVVRYDVSAYTVNFTAPDYPYNNDSP